MRRRSGASAAVATASAIVALFSIAPIAVGDSTERGPRAAGTPAGFQEEVVFSGLTNPTGVRFSPDGRVFVAEKSGLIKVFDSLADTSPTTFADLRTKVHNFWDRGLLGIELHPNFPAVPSVYVLYTHDAAIGGTAPRWGTAGASSDPCPSPPGPTGDGCVVSGRLSRLQASGNVMTSETVLIEDWCQQYPSHSVGTLDFGADGMLYVSGGDGASFNFVDYGQDGNPANPCADPPGSAGSTLTPPTAQGGALRSQDLRTSGDPVTLDGAILRVDPTTGAGAPGNPYASSTNANQRRIIAYGLRNPFRFAIRPGTNEVWTGDVGWDTWEEINRVVDPTDGVVENFGWPCYEGAGRQSGYDGADLSICEGLYSQAGAHTPAYFSYNHSARVVAGETCATGSSSLAGVAFGKSGGSYPVAYAGAMFVADYSRDCIWVLFPGSNGLPSTGAPTNFVMPAANPVDLQMSPSGELFYADFDGGTIRRIRYAAGNQRPTAAATATPSNGTAPLTVQFNAAGSTDPDFGDVLSYAWDLDGDTAFDDSTAVAPTRTYAVGTYAVTVRVSDQHGASDTETVTISAGNSAPTATINAPSSSTTWRVGTTVTFSGAASDPQQGQLPGTSLRWDLILHHCPSNCHTHPVQTFTGSSGSFAAPDHEYPTHLELRLTATDAGGLTDVKSVLLQPQTVALTFTSSPDGLQLTVGSETRATPFTRTVIIGSNNSISAPTPQTVGGSSYQFMSWSDGGGQTHNLSAPATPTTYTATYGVVDVVLSKSDDGVVKVGGESFDYSLGVDNVGTRDVASGNSVTVTDVLPAGLEYVLPAPAGCSVAGQTLTCSVPAANLQVADPVVVIVVRVRVSPTAVPATVTNKAFVSTAEDLACGGTGCVPVCPPLNNNVDCEPTDIEQRPTLTLNKVVVNDHGGQAAVGGFTLTATPKAGGPALINGSDPNAASTTIGITATATKNITYVLTETGPAGYAASGWTCSAGTLVGHEITLQANQNANCIITNDDIDLRTAMSLSVTDNVLVSITAGDQFVYDMVVTNDGQSPLTDIELDDDVPDEVSLVAAGGAGWTCAIVDPLRCTYAAELAPGQASAALTVSVQLVSSFTGDRVFNSAMATASSRGTQLVAGDDETTTVAAGVPPTSGISIDATVNGFGADVAPGLVVEQGATLAFAFTVTNSGSAGLSGVTVATNSGTVVSCPFTTLDVKAQMQCAAVTAANTPGQLTEIASASATSSTGAVVRAIDSVNAFVAVPALDLTNYVNGADANAAPGLAVPAGSSIIWMYRVENVGNVDLLDVAISDAPGSNLHCDGSGAIPTLRVGEVRFCSSIGVVTLGLTTSTVTARGTPGPSLLPGQASFPMGAAVDTDRASYTGHVVVPPPPPLILPEGDLPATGSSTKVVWLLATAFVFAGVVLTGLSRRGDRGRASQVKASRR